MPADCEPLRTGAEVAARTAPREMSRILDEAGAARGNRGEVARQRQWVGPYLAARNSEASAGGRDRSEQADARADSQALQDTEEARPQKMKAKESDEIRAKG